MRELVRYWSTEYDFGRIEARLNELPQYATEIDGWTSTSSTSGGSTRTRCR
jgi:Epoxide hydrolase N terminus